MTTEPTARVRPAWTAAVALANVGVFAAWFGPIQVLLAKQSEAVAPGNKEFVFGLVTGIGAAVSVVAAPIFGAVSDRTTSRFGRRMPWTLGGALGAAAGLLVLSGAQGVALMLVGWCLVQLFGNAVLAAQTATVPDRVPVSQRGVVGGWVAVAQVPGALVGTALATIAGGITLGYVACAVFMVLSVVPYVVRAHDAPLSVQPPPFVLREFLRGFWISPRRYPDFGWAWLTRFLFNVGNSIGLLYLFYYLQDEVGVPDAATAVLILTAIYSVCTLTTAIAFGSWSDRTGRRKIFVISSGLVMAAAGVVLASWPTWPGAITGAIVLGIGFGVYLSVDFALITEVLPNARDRAKDLGVINIANSFPQVLAPVIAAPIVKHLGVINIANSFPQVLAPVIAAPIVKHLGGYPVLYLLSATITALAGVLVSKVRSVP